MPSANVALPSTALSRKVSADRALRHHRYGAISRSPFARVMSCGAKPSYPCRVCRGGALALVVAHSSSSFDFWRLAVVGFHVMVRRRVATPFNERRYSSHSALEKACHWSEVRMLSRLIHMLLQGRVVARKYASSLVFCSLDGGNSASTGLFSAFPTFVDFYVDHVFCL